MRSGRLEALTDGVVAIVLTITVLELRIPDGGGVEALKASAPLFLAYALSFVNVGLYWANHHHLFQAADHIDGRVLWPNLFLLFWLTLVPFVIRWLDQSGFAPAPTAAYGVVLALAGVGYQLTERAIIAVNGSDSALAQAVGDDRKAMLSLAGYVIAVPLAFVSVWISIAIYVTIAALWLIPDRRIERHLIDRSSSS